MTSAAMFERRRLAKAHGDTDSRAVAARKRFGALHGASSLANLLGFGAALTYTWFVAEGL